MRRIDCLEALDRAIDDTVITVSSLSGNQMEWAHVRKRGPNFTGLNMGMCAAFAAGIALALKDCLARRELSMLIAKVEPGMIPLPEELQREYRRDDGRPVKEHFVRELRKLPP